MYCNLYSKPGALCGHNLLYHVGFFLYAQKTGHGDYVEFKEACDDETMILLLCGVNGF